MVIGGDLMITTEKINKIPDGQIQIKGINALKNAQKRNNNKAVEKTTDLHA